MFIVYKSFCWKFCGCYTLLKLLLPQFTYFFTKFINQIFQTMENINMAILYATKAMITLMILVFINCIGSLGLYYTHVIMTSILDWHPFLYLYNTMLVLISLRAALLEW